MIVPDEDYLRDAAELCRKAGTLFVADEIQTGLGRTGTMLTSASNGAEADIVLISKALSGGMVPVGAIMLRNDLLELAFDSVDRSVSHSSTFRRGAVGNDDCTRSDARD